LHFFAFLIIIRKLYFFTFFSMTDQTVPSTTGQTSTPSPQPTKKTFFGGEIAFDDPTAFEAVDIPQTS
jgi:hypothetical protein